MKTLNDYYIEGYDGMLVTSKEPHKYLIFFYIKRREDDNYVLIHYCKIYKDGLIITDVGYLQINNIARCINKNELQKYEQQLRSFYKDN